MQIDTEKLLLASKEDINNWVNETTVQNSNFDAFHPNEMEPNKNTVLIQAKEHNRVSQLKDGRRVKLQAIFVPIAMFLPAGLGFLFQLDPIFIATEFTFGIVAILLYFLFVVKVATWRKKKFETQLDVAEKAAKNIVNQRATQWVRARHALPRGNIIFSDFHDFRLENGVFYEWAEETPGAFVLVETESGNPPPLKTITR